MVMAPVDESYQIFFLLFAALSTNLILGFRLDKIAEAYATAMRIMENAILEYVNDSDSDIQKLIEANKMAEQHLSNKFF